MVVATCAQEALQVWSACEPCGYVAWYGDVENSMPEIRAELAKRVQQTTQSSKECPTSPGDMETHMKELFGFSAAAAPLFPSFLRAHDEKVHFLYFWRGVSEAWRCIEGPSAVTLDDLTIEVEMVRDRLLLLFDLQASKPMEERTVSACKLAEVLDATQHMSVDPDFWAEVRESTIPSQRFSLEDVTVMLLSWLHEAVARQMQMVQWRSTHEDEKSDCRSLVHLSKAAEACRAEAADSESLPVLLHIYDVSQEDSIKRINSVFAHKYAPVKLGGIFHAAVEVNGLEWCFGASDDETVPGVSCMLPRNDPSHHYRQTIRLGTTRCTAEDIADIISDLVEEYPGDDYDLLRRNCCHFADDFCRRLHVGRIPLWVHRLARLGARVDCALASICTSTARIGAEQACCNPADGAGWMHSFVYSRFRLPPLLFQHCSLIPEARSRSRPTPN